MKDRSLRCRHCGEVYVITKTTTGFGFVKPDSWFVPAGITWQAVCISTCPPLVSDSEWGLYHQMGY